MKRTRINPISKKQAKRLRDRQPVINALVGRCGGVCEICHKPDIIFGLHPHHKIKLSQGGKDTEENMIMLCQVCHMKEHGLCLREKIRELG